MSDPDNSVVRRAQAGERQALVDLVEKYQGQVYSLALGIMRNPADAADMTQETFVRLLRSLGSYRGETATFRTWLHRLAVNVCLDGLRRRGRQPLTLSHDTDLVSADEWEQPTWRAEWRESAAEVRAALAALPSRQRVALTLHYFQESSYEQIADATGVPLNTVKSHILRGKARLARMLRQSAARAAVTNAAWLHVRPVTA
jgi:RNA polymerase sigma-70 factor, ECF subfamily